MRAAIAFLVGAAGLSSLAGCSDPTPTEQPRSGRVDLEYGQLLFVQKIEVNGRLISCVIFTGTSKGGVSCDFTREATP